MNFKKVKITIEASNSPNIFSDNEFVYMTANYKNNKEVEELDTPVGFKLSKESVADLRSAVGHLVEILIGDELKEVRGDEK